jgi:D-aminoacyl-tRNA deacylase
MFKKYLIIASKKDIAGINITTHLSQLGTYDFYLRDEDIVSDKNLNLKKINEYDFIIFASKHKSEKKGKTLSVHAIGNWRQNEFGGEPNKICPTSAQFLKQAFEKLNKNVEKHHLQDYKVTLECTHHGPLIDKPCIFIEIGATETEWKDRRAGFVVAHTIKETIETFRENPYNEIAIGIGGPHYCPNFNKIQLSSNVAIGHIIPGYMLPLKEEMIQEILDKSVEEIDLAILDWKGIQNADIRNQIKEILDRFYIRYKRTSNIEK